MNKGARKSLQSTANRLHSLVGLVGELLLIISNLCMGKMQQKSLYCIDQHMNSNTFTLKVKQGKAKPFFTINYQKY